MITGRVVAVRGDELVLARGATLYRSYDSGRSWTFWARLPVGNWRRIAMRLPLFARLLRLGVHHVVLSNSSSIVIANKESFLIDENGTISLGRLQGSRPMALCVAEGKAFYGEYRANSQRSPVSVFGLDLKEKSWKPVWTFRGVRHIHGVYYDPYKESFWVTTGTQTPSQPFGGRMITSIR